MIKAKPLENYTQIETCYPNDCRNGYICGDLVGNRYIAMGTENYNGNMHNIQIIEINPDTIKRGTGFKDINKAEIFESDVVKFYNKPDDKSHYELYLVIYNGIYGRFELQSIPAGHKCAIRYGNKYEIVDTATAKYIRQGVPERCRSCKHCKETDGSGDVKIMRDGFENDFDTVYYCDYVEYYDKYDCPVPYPYFYKEDKACSGFSE